MEMIRCRSQAGGDLNAGERSAAGASLLADLYLSLRRSHFMHSEQHRHARSGDIMTPLHLEQKMTNYRTQDFFYFYK